MENKIIESPDVSQDFLMEIKNIIMEMWDAHDRLQTEAVSKKEAEAFFEKIEWQISSAKGRLKIQEEELKRKIAELEAQDEDSDS